MEVLGQNFIDCVLGQCKPDCELCINDNKIEEKDMPMGKGTYGSQKGRPAKKGLTAKQKTLPVALQKKIVKKKKK